MSGSGGGLFGAIGKRFAAGREYKEAGANLEQARRKFKETMSGEPTGSAAYDAMSRYGLAEFRYYTAARAAGKPSPGDFDVEGARRLLGSLRITEPDKSSDGRDEGGHGESVKVLKTVSLNECVRLLTRFLGSGKTVGDALVQVHEGKTARVSTQIRVRRVGDDAFQVSEHVISRQDFGS